MVTGAKVQAADIPVDPDLTLQLAADGNQAPKQVAESFWEQSDIQLSRWNKLYPYQLLVVRAMKRADGGVSHQVEPGWQFTLPMPPESLSVSTPFAITAVPTLGGIIEEHNGAPFRLITLRGSTGMLPARAAAQQQMGFSIVETIAGGTVAQLRRVQGDFAATQQSLLGTTTTNPNIHKLSDFLKDETETGAAALVAKTTGWYQFRQLQRFLELYVSIKKSSSGRDLRLALAIWKDQAVYLVTPQAFEFNKSGASPLEYLYTLNLKAWRRITLETSALDTALGTPLRRDPNKLARLLNTLQDARRTLQSVSKVAAAAIGDIDRLVFEPMRECVLFVKDALGVGLTLAELPDSITAKTQESWVQMQGDVLSTGAAASELNDVVKLQLGHGIDAANETRDMTSTRASRARSRVLAAHPARKPFTAPKQNFDLMSKAEIGRINLPPAISQQINAERARISALTRRDFETRRDSFRQAADALAIALGAGHATYEDTYRVNVKKIKNEPTQSDWEALYSLNAAAMAMDSFAATGDNEPSSREDLMDVMAGLLRRSGIAFQVPTSKFAVPFPYGATLEALAAQYLGDPQRWHEIAALNGLREPYIDEVGFDIFLTVNGQSNQVVIPKTGNLYIGQVVFVWSDAARRTRRRIVALREVGDSLVVTVDGAKDMALYKRQDGAKLSAFLPDTVNSQSLIYIPSNLEPAEDNFITKSIPGVNEFDPMVSVGGVSLLLDNNNDLVIAPDGTSRLAAGLTNIIQNVRIALSVKRGTLLHHPEFGLPLEVGMSTADFNPSEVLGAVRRMLSEDPAFARVDAVQVQKSGPTAKINVAVVVKGTEQPVPISYDVRGDFQTA